jgi:glycosyltransferase involved in cell wall biosynthesis
MAPSFLVSIICVTFNAEKHLPQFLASVKKYKPSDCELIIFDGKSTDNTASILRENASLIDLSISEADTGIYNAMNKAVAYANGQWLYFIGADDLLLPDFATFITYLKDKNTIYHGNILMDGETIVRSADAYRLAKENISHQTLFYPISIFKKYSYNEKYKICADYELNLKLRGDRRYKFEFVPLTPAKFGTDGLSSQKKDELFERTKATIVLKNLGLGVYFRLLFKMLKLKRSSVR